MKLEERLNAAAELALPDGQILYFPPLIKTSDTGKLRVWYIFARIDPQITAADLLRNIQMSIHVAGHYQTGYGELGGAITQSAETDITSGKNRGRSNETSAAQQCLLDVASVWTRKVDNEGYVQIAESYEPMRGMSPMEIIAALAEEGAGDGDNEGGECGKAGADGIPIAMLAHEFKDTKLKFPTMAQYKYNGVRALGLYDGSRIVFYSRKKKIFTGLEHLEQQLLATIRANNCEIVHGTVFDGEIYIHGQSLQSIISILKKEGRTEAKACLNYHIYDIFVLGRTDVEYRERRRYLESLFAAPGLNLPNVATVKTYDVANRAELDHLFDLALMESYEGLIIRDPTRPYRPGIRELMKYKPFYDAEFKIIGFETGRRGKAVGKVIFRLITDAGIEFTAEPTDMTEAESRALYADLCAKSGAGYINKMATVQYMSLSKDGVPQHQKFVAIRDYE